MAENGNGNGNGKGWWVAGLLASSIVSSSATWLMVGRDAVTRGEVERMIAQSMPKDSGYIEDKKALKDQNERTTNAVNSLSTDMSTVKIQLGAVGAKLDMLLAQKDHESTPRVTR